MVLQVLSKKDWIVTAANVGRCRGNGGGQGVGREPVQPCVDLPPARPRLALAAARLPSLFLSADLPTSGLAMGLNFTEP